MIKSPALNHRVLAFSTLNRGGLSEIGSGSSLVNNNSLEEITASVIVQLGGRVPVLGPAVNSITFISSSNTETDGMGHINRSAHSQVSVEGHTIRVGSVDGVKLIPLFLSN